MSHVVVLVTVCLSAPGLAADETGDADLRVHLNGGLTRTTHAGPTRADILLDLKLRDGAVKPEVWGYAVFYNEFGAYAHPYNKQDHSGEVRHAVSTERGWKLRIEMPIRGDRFQQSVDREADWTIDLVRDGNSLTGTFEGTFDGNTVQGDLGGEVNSLWPAQEPGFKPIQPGEHPRLLFRKSDIPGLRKRAKTAQGKEIVEQLREALTRPMNPENAGYHAAGMGMLFVLTGEQRYADNTATLVGKIIRNRAPGGENFWISSYKLILRVPPAVGVALAYDLCYEGWDEPFRMRVAAALEAKAEELIEGKGRGTNEHPHSNWMGMARGGAGICALAILGDAIAPPAAPIPLGQAERIEPHSADDSNRTPIAEFSDNSMPKVWIGLGPFGLAKGDPLEALGGPTRASLGYDQMIGGLKTFSCTEDNTRGRYSGTPAIAFDMYGYQKEFAPFLGGKKHPDVTPPEKPCVYFFCAIRNDEARTAVVRYAMEGKVETWIAGQKVTEGQAIELDKGVYPVLLRVALNEGNFAAMMLDGTTKAEYDAQLADWEKSMADYRARRGQGVTVPRSLAIAERSIKRYLYAGISDHGTGAEGDEYLRYAWCHGVAPYLQMLRRVMGRDLIEASGAGWVLPAWAIRMRIGDRPEIAGFGTGGTDWGRELYRSGDWGMGLGATRRDLLPGMRWTFNHMFGHKGDGSYDINQPHHAVFALANLPPDEEGSPAALPLAITDERLGMAAFRNRWHDADDLTASIYAKSLILQGYWNQPDAGSFRIMGLGGKWAIQGGEDKVAGRGAENVVFTDDRATWLGGAMEVISLARQIAVAHVNLDDTYLVYRETGQPPPDLAEIAGEGKKGSFYDLGERGERWFAVDHSGASGAAGVYVVYDVIKSDASAEWRMHTGEKQVAADGATFTIATRGGATLKGTVVQPAGAMVTLRGQQIAVAGGESENKRLLVVMTVQDGNAPEVHATIDGDVGRVRIGKRRMSFNADGLMVEVD